MSFEKKLFHIPLYTFLTHQFFLSSLCSADKWTVEHKVYKQLNCPPSCAC